MVFLVLQNGSTKRIKKIFGNIQHVFVYFDDIIIAGANEEEHNETLRKVLIKAREVGVRFNPEKIQYCVSEVQYLGKIIQNNQLYPIESQIQTITEMPTPLNKDDIRQLLGMINYLANFIPNAAIVTAPLCELLQKDIEFQWNGEQEEAF